MDRFVPSRHVRPVLVHDGVDAVEFASWHMTQVLGLKSLVLTTEDARRWEEPSDIQSLDAVAHVSFVEPPGLLTLKRLALDFGIDQLVLAYVAGELDPNVLEFCEREYIGLFRYSIYADVEPQTRMAHRALDPRRRKRVVTEGDGGRGAVEPSNDVVRGPDTPSEGPTPEMVLERFRAELESRASSTIEDLDELKRLLEPFTWLQQRAVHRRQPPPFPRDLVGRSNEIRTLLKKLEGSDTDHRLTTDMRLRIGRVFEDRLDAIDRILDRELGQLGRDWDHGDALDAMRRSRAERK